MNLGCAIESIRASLTDNHYGWHQVSHARDCDTSPRNRVHSRSLPHFLTHWRPGRFYYPAPGQREQHHGNRCMIGFVDAEWLLGDHSFLCRLQELVHHLLMVRRQLEHPPALKIRYGTDAEHDCRLTFGCFSSDCFLLCFPLCGPSSCDCALGMNV